VLLLEQIAVWFKMTVKGATSWPGYTSI